jgi:hypothetical protein
VIVSLVRRFDRWPRAGALVLVTLTTFADGCGSSERSESRGVPGVSKVLKPEDYYRYEGEGRKKKKVALSRQERSKLRSDAAKKLEAQ